MKTPAYGWLEPSVYSRRLGVSKHKKKPIVRYILLAGLLVNGAVFMASANLNQQFDGVVGAQQSQIQNIEQSTLPQQISETPKPPEPAYLIDSELQSILNSWANNKQNQDWSIVVKTFGYDKRYAAIRGDSWYVPASLYKLLLTYPLFQKYDMNNLEAQKITVGKEQKSIKICIEAMLKWSDNDCGEALGKYLGWYRADSALQSIGLKQTQLNRKDAMFSNANDVNKFLENLYEGNSFSADERAFILSNMQNGTWRKGIPSGCEDCTVTNKTGDLPNVRHDAAIVNYKGGAYAITIMTSGASYSDIADIAGQIHSHIASTQP